MSLLIDPEEVALKGLVSAICTNCIKQGTTSRNDIENIVEQYKDRYPSLTADMIEGGIITASIPELESYGAGDDDDAAVEEERSGAMSNSGRSRKRPRLPSSRRQQPPVVDDANPNTNPNNAAPTKFIPKKYRCRHEGCPKYAQKGGVCIAHGAKLTCKHEGCTKWAQKRGVCCTHGASELIKQKPKKMCNFAGGCTNQVVRGGVCIRHGAKRKRNNNATPRLCDVEGCTNQRVRKGVCIAHGAKDPKPHEGPPTCNHAGGCTNKAFKGGKCRTHGDICSHQECQNNIIRNGLCKKHGALDDTPHKLCAFPFCFNLNYARGVCWKHAHNEIPVPWHAPEVASYGKGINDKANNNLDEAAASNPPEPEKLISIK